MNKKREKCIFKKIKIEKEYYFFHGKIYFPNNLYLT